MTSMRGHVRQESLADRETGKPRRYCLVKSGAWRSNIGAAFRGSMWRVRPALLCCENLGKAQRNAESARGALAFGVEKVKLASLARDPDFFCTGLQIGTGFLGDFRFGVRRRNDFNANLRCFGKNVCGAVRLHKRLRRPSDVRYPQADFREYRTLGKYDPLRQLAPEFDGYIPLDACMTRSGRTHFNLPPRIEFDFIRQVLQARVTQHFLPSQEQRFARCKASHWINRKQKNDDDKYTPGS